MMALHHVVVRHEQRIPGIPKISRLSPVSNENKTLKHLNNFCLAVPSKTFSLRH